jgi:hypothetical protein
VLPRLVVAALLCISFTKLQEVRFHPILVPGDEFKLLVTYVRGSSSRPEATQTLRKAIQVRVHSAGPLGYEVDWLPTVEGVDAANGKPDPVMAMAAGLVADLRFRLSLDPDGSLDGVVNEVELTQHFEQILKIAMEGVRESRRDIAPAELQKMEAVMSKILSPTVLMQDALRDAQAYFAFNGLALEVGRSSETKFERANPLGGGPIAGVNRVTLESATQENAIAMSKATYDSAALLKSSVGLLEQLGEGLPEDFLKQLNSSLIDEGRAVFDRRLGLVRDVTLSRIMSAGPIRQTERWTINLVSEPKRLGSAGDHFEPVSLDSLANAPLTWLALPLSGRQQLGGIPFVLGAGDRAVFTTRDHTRASAPAQGTLKVQLANVVGIHVLVAGGWIASVKPGMEVGRIRLVFDNGRTVDQPLSAGVSIREGWAPMDATTQPSDAKWKNVWSEAQFRGNDVALGYLDLLSLDVPSELRSSTLTAIQFVDNGTTSPNTHGQGVIDPSISIVGVTLRLRGK